MSPDPPVIDTQEGRAPARTDSLRAVAVLVAAFTAGCRADPAIRAGLIAVPDRHRGGLRALATWPAGSDAPAVAHGACAGVLDNGRPVFESPQSEAGGANLLAVPLADEGRTIGAVALLVDGTATDVERAVGAWRRRLDAALDAAVAAAAGAGDGTGAGEVTDGVEAVHAADVGVIAAADHATDHATDHAPEPPGVGAVATPAEDARPRAAGELARIVDCQAALAEAERLGDAIGALLATLARQHGCSRVAFGWAAASGVRVQALSDGVGVRPSHDVVAPIATAMDEAIDQQGAVAWPEPCVGDAPVNVAQAQLARLSQVGATCSVPLIVRGRALGAISFERASPAFDADELAGLQRLAALLAPVVAMHRRIDRPMAAFGERLLERRARAGWIAAAVLAVLMLASLVPVPDRVGGAARVEGAMQRLLTAPVDGWLLRVHVRPGDAVSEGQVLVELDDRELSQERLRWSTEAEQAGRQATEALAREDRAQYAVHAARAVQARAQLSMVDTQLARQRVAAPFDGLVLSGDLTQSLGAPVKAGDTLLSVAPAGRHRVIVDVDERDVARVAQDAEGVLALGAHAGGVVSIRVVRISPAAVARDGRTVFEIEAAPAAGAELRPGYEGVAKFEAGSRRLGQVLFERPWRALADRIWALGW
jgi:multidrug efflux pump subunit AcrA (membrane-fusion protein)